MCGRYAATNPDEIRRRFPAFDFKEAFRARYNIAPTQAVVIVKNDGTRSAGLARWGLIPAWAKSVDAQRIQPINAKMETLTESRMFAPLLKRKRCVLFADGFYEWKTEGAKKTPYFFQLKSGLPFAFAGLWDTWRNEIVSCALITGEPNALVAPIHNRMPMMLDPEAALQWVADGEQKWDDYYTLLKPYDAELMHAFPVSAKVNKPAYDSADLIEPCPVEVQPYFIKEKLDT
jgi:putative SOS response-associated peptidase YedK